MFDRKLKYDNRGASLFFVIICITFIAMLGSIVVSTTVQNIEMKAMDKGHKENFYDAEAALNEIKLSLSELVSNAVSEAYTDVLENYSDSNIGKRTKIYQDSFIAELRIGLGLNNNEVSIPASKINSFLLETKYDIATNTGAKVENNTTLVNLVDNTGIAIRDLTVYYYVNGYATSITTDIIIKYPENAFTASMGPIVSMPYKDYALIANESLEVKTTSHTISGNVYAGLGGMQVDGENSSLSIDGNTIISAGDIVVSEKATFKVNGLLNPEANVEPNIADAEIWANSIITTQDDKSAEKTIETQVLVNGRTYIKDDLSLNAKKSNVSFLGEYYGFSSGNTPETSSAITINSTNTKLNLEHLSRLSLAGRAFVSLANNEYNTDPTLGAVVASNSNMLTGESLIIKGSQSLYLVPDNYVKVGHNPVSWAEYELHYASGDMVLIPLDALIFTERSIPLEQTRLFYYLNETEPYKKVFYKFGSNNNVVYYYLNFKTPELATTYSKNYRLSYPERMDTGYPIDSITLNESAGSLISAGNLFSYDDSLRMVFGSNGNYVSNYLGQYNNLTHTLQKYNYSTDDVFHHIVDVNKLKSAAIGNSGVALQVDTSDYMVRIIDNPSSVYTLDQANKKGLIIATGDVNIKANFTGLVLSGNKITLMGGANVTESQILIQSIINTNPDVRAYFDEFSDEQITVPGSSNKINISELIYYENWKKN